MAQSSQSSMEGNTLGSSASESSGESEIPFSKEEVDLILRMYRLVGKRWALIAGRIPGRTAAEMKIYWNIKNSPQS